MFPGPCRSAVTVDEETDGTSSVGGFGKAGLDFLPSAGGSTVPGFSVKVTDLFWSPCAVDTHACTRKNTKQVTHWEKNGRRDGTGGGRDWERMQDRHAERPMGLGCR